METTNFKAIKVDQDNLIVRFVAADISEMATEEMEKVLTRSNLVTALKMGRISFVQFLVMWAKV